MQELRMSPLAGKYANVTVTTSPITFRNVSKQDGHYARMSMCKNIQHETRN